VNFGFSCPVMNLNPLRRPDILGSLPSVSCSVCGFGQQLVDTDARQGYVRGSLSFGPAVLGSGNLSQVQEYRLHIVDVFGHRLGGAVASVPSRVPPTSECCLASFFTAHVQTALPPKASRFAITPVVDGVELPTGTATNAILDLVAQGQAPVSPAASTTMRLPAIAALRSLLSIETPRGGELIVDTAAQTAIAGSLATLAQLPAYAVSVASVTRRSTARRRLAVQTRLTAECIVAVLAGMSSPEVERRLTGIVLADLEAEIAVRLAHLSKGFYALRVVNLTVPRPASTGVPPVLPTGGTGPDAASSVGAIIGIVFGALACCTLLVCLTAWRILMRRLQGQRQKVIPYREGELADPESGCGAKGAEGGSSGHFLGLAPVPEPFHPQDQAVLPPEAPPVRPPEDPPPLLPPSEEAPPAAGEEADSPRPGLLLPGELATGGGPPRGCWVEEPSGPRFDAIVPSQRGQAGAGEELWRPPGEHGASSAGVGHSGAQRQRAPRARDPLAASNIHLITTVNRAGRGQHDARWPERG